MGIPISFMNKTKDEYKAAANRMLNTYKREDMYVDIGFGAGVKALYCACFGAAFPAGTYYKEDGDIFETMLQCIIDDKPYSAAETGNL
ncbi:MAG: hypothetical protein LBH43_11985 [Treponema sp.]|nr:hypothetical protein [Treponema sp.]